MGLLEKMGLVERDDTVLPTIVEPPEPVAAVDVDIDRPQGVVDAIYGQNGLQDKSNSIYTVQALIETLPAEMTTAKKQATVSGILAVSGKLLPDLMEDAAHRTDILQAAQEQIIHERTQEIDSAKADIEELKRLIEAANIRIKDAEEIIEVAKKDIEDELGVISGLQVFCEGMEAKQ